MLQTTASAACATFLITALLLPVLIPIARRTGLVDRPGGRRKHDNPVPAVGGVAIFLALALATTWFVEPSPQLLGIGVAVMIIVAAGVADDIFRLKWPVRLAAQCAAALAMVDLGGVRIENLGEVFGPAGVSLGVLATPLAVMAAVGIVNAVNMVDGVDGLAGLLILAACVMLGAAAAYAGNEGLSLALALIGGAVGGFLIYNMRSPWTPRARVFLGNAGSELLGLLFACASIRLTQNAAHPVGVQLAPFLLAPVLIDCLTLMIRRIRAGVSPFHGDRNHLHHMLLDAGLSPSRVAMALTATSLVLGCAAAAALKAHAPPIAFTLTFAAMWLGYVLATGDRERFVGWARAVGLKAGLIPPAKPLEAWQIAIRAAGGHYRRKGDHPLHGDDDLRLEDQATARCIDAAAATGRDTAASVREPARPE